MVAAGELFGRKIDVQPDDFVIAADAGWRYCDEQGIRYDLLVGDFDSAPRPETQAEIECLPVHKDVTDTWAALDTAVRRGFDDIRLYAGAGGRFDHTLANVQMLAYHAARGRRVIMYCDKLAVTALHNGEMTLPKPGTNAAPAGTPEDEPRLAVFAFGGDAKDVCVRGALYTLEHAVLTPEFPLGVSNFFASDSNAAELSVGDGTLIVMWQDVP